MPQLRLWRRKLEMLTEGAGMALVSVDKMLRRTEPGGPDHTLTLALKEHLYGA